MTNIENRKLLIKIKALTFGKKVTFKNKFAKILKIALRISNKPYCKRTNLYYIGQKDGNCIFLLTWKYYRKKRENAKKHKNLN